MIGYMLIQELKNLMPSRNVTALLTQVQVDPKDPAFANPTKFIGPVYEEAEARALAAEAWGGYWSWDPKETWALIVWLNYAAWLHMRLMKGLRGTVSAWWALVGLAVTTFAFLGVNMFLSGLHSYGTL